LRGRVKRYGWEARSKGTVKRYGEEMPRGTVKRCS